MNIEGLGSAGTEWGKKRFGARKVFSHHQQTSKPEKTFQAPKSFVSPLGACWLWFSLRPEKFFRP